MVTEIATRRDSLNEALSKLGLIEEQVNFVTLLAEIRSTVSGGIYNILAVPVIY